MSVTLPASARPASADARHSVLHSDDTDLVCPSCSSGMTVTANPYYGTGLAEHRTIALCKGCLNIAFIPEAEVETEARVAGQLVGRLLGMFGRR